MSELGLGMVVGLGLLATAGAVALVVVQLWRDSRTRPTNGAAGAGDAPAAGARGGAEPRGAARRTIGAAPPRSEGEVVRRAGAEGAR
jgi:hypothetical protein